MDENDGGGPAPTSGKPVDPRLLRYASASRGFFVAIGAIALGADGRRSSRSRGC